MSRPVAAVEISEQGCEQMNKAAGINSLGGRLEVYNKDLRNVREFLPAGEFDVVTMNPPYKAEGAGIVNADETAARARHGLCCSLDDMCEAAAWLLKFGGKFCVCLRPERLCELMCKMSAAGIEPKRLRTVSKRDGCAPWLVLVEGKRGGKPGMTVEPQLNIYDGDEYSEYMKCSTRTTSASVKITTLKGTILINERCTLCCRHADRQSGRPLSPRDRCV